MINSLLFEGIVIAATYLSGSTSDIEADEDREDGNEGEDNDIDKRGEGDKEDSYLMEDLDFWLYVHGVR